MAPRSDRLAGVDQAGPRLDRPLADEAAAVASAVLEFEGVVDEEPEDSCGRFAAGLAAKIAARLEPVVAAAGRAAQRDVGPAGVRQGDHPVRPGQRKTPEVVGTRPQRLTRSVVRDVAPPALTRWVRSRRRSG